MGRGLGIATLAVLVLLGTATARAADVHSSNARLVAELDLGGPQTDIAFWGDHAVVGYWGDPLDPTDDGFRVVDISKPERPRLLGSLTCGGSHYDVGIWEDVVVLSVNELQGNPECGGDPDETGDSFAGLQIISIANPRRPVQLASVPLCLDDPLLPGSHTNTIIPDLDRPEPRLIVYSSTTCVEIVEIPLSDPAKARRLRSIDAAPDIGCHDITVHLARRLAWCGLFQSQIWDIADPANPRRLAVIENPLLDLDHSATFSADGNTIAISDERLVDRGPLCYGGTPAPVGAIWFYDVTNPAVPVPRGFHQLAQGGIEGWCTAHQTNLVPLPGGRDVMSVAWYRGGMELVDFTDPANPSVLAHYIAEPDDPDHRFSYAWSAYWYRDHVYMTNSALIEPAGGDRSRRGLDVVRVEDPALADALDLPYLNAQTQGDFVRRSADATQPACRFDRRVVMRVRLARRDRIRSVRAHLDGRQVPASVSRTRPGRISVDLRRVAAGRHRLVVRLRTAKGRTLTLRRTARGC